MNLMENIAKYILYVFNVLFLICGILLIILGSFMSTDMGTFKAFQQAVNSEAIYIIVIVLGALIAVISFFGCCGAIRENIFCSSVYATFLFILLCLQIALVAWAFVGRTKFLSDMAEVVETAWKENDYEHDYPMDSLQLAFSCCGLNSYDDYIANNQTVPNSCCGAANSNNINHVCPNFIYMSHPGCQSAFAAFWQKSLEFIQWGGIAVAIVEFVAIILSFTLIHGIRRLGPEIYEVEIKY